MSHLPGKFVWFEHASPDVARARRFYEDLFGWHVETMPLGEQTYSMIMNGGDAIGGLRTLEAGLASHWISYLSVPDVDQAHAAALAAGARSTLAPTDFGDVGRGAHIVDPTGAAFALWTGTQGDRPDVVPTPVGDWYWNELTTADERKALAFYETVFGYTHDTMDLGGGSTYYLLKTGDTMRGGLMRIPRPEVPTLWQPYVRVADCDASQARAVSLGAQTLMPPTDIPEVGRFAVLLDPLGASIAVIQPVPLPA